MLKLTGNYILNLKIGGEVVAISPGMINELTITLDIDRILPTFKMGLKDASGLLGEIIPYDKSSNDVSLEIARGSHLSDLNNFEFTVKRRNSTQDRYYEVEGLLKVDGLLTPPRSRALTGNIKSSIEQISNDELSISRTEIGASLDYEKTILQPQWANMKLFRYLKDNLGGNGGEAGYYCFVKNVEGEKVLVFKSLEELFSSPVSCKLIVGHKQYQDFYPIVDYRIIDNSSILSDFGAQRLDYNYFEYITGEYKSSHVDIGECSALTQNFLVDKDNDTQFRVGVKLGRSNDFTLDFDERIRNIFFKKLTNSIHMWAATWGLENMSPGDIVLVMFAEAFRRGKLFSYQHAGCWMVKRVVHIVGQTFLTNLLLVRAGIDTDIENSLLEVEKQLIR